MYKIGIIGTSQIARKFTEAIKLEKRASAQVIYSRNLQTALNFAKENQISIATDDLEVLFGSETDIIYIATPNKIHYKQVKEALMHNKHVIVEKPISIHAAEVAELYELAQAKKLLLIVAVKTGSMNTHQQLKSNLNLIGPIKSFEFNIMRHYENYPMETDIDNRANIYRHQLDGGVISDLASYAIYPLLDLLPSEYQVITTRFQEKYLDVETEIHAFLEFAGIKGQINLSMCTQGENKSLIIGEHGYVIIDSLSQFNLVEFYNLHNELILKIGKNHQHLMERELNHLVDLLENGERNSHIYRKELAIASQKLMEQLRR